MMSTTTIKAAAKAVDPAPLAAHKHASQHRVELEASTRCGCFFCFKTFPPTSIKSWIDAKQTALCPACGVDSVLGSASSVRIDDTFLRNMHRHFFAYRTK